MSKTHNMLIFNRLIFIKQVVKSTNHFTSRFAVVIVICIDMPNRGWVNFLQFRPGLTFLI